MSPFVYTQNSPISKLIKNFKYNFYTTTTFEIKKIIKNFIIQKVKIIIKIYEINEINFVPIPIHPKRLKERGFNQARILTESICSILKENSINCRILELIKRNKHTKKQARLNKENRSKNIQSCFQISKKNIQVKNHKLIIIVDDIYSTGSTINEAVKTIKAHYNQQKNISHKPIFGALTIARAQLSDIILPT